MKKFLSILLALAVGFTFTFGSAMSAFADPDSTGTTTGYDDNYAKAVLDAASVQATATAFKLNYDNKYQDQKEEDNTAVDDITVFEIKAEYVQKAVDATYVSAVDAIKPTENTDILGATLKGDYNGSNAGYSVDVAAVRAALLTNATTDKLAVAEKAAFDEYKAMLKGFVESADLSIFTETKQDKPYKAKDGKAYYTSAEAAAADKAWALKTIEDEQFKDANTYSGLYTKVFNTVITIEENKDDVLNKNVVTSLTYTVRATDDNGAKYATKKSEAADAANLSVAQATAKAKLLQAVTTWQNDDKKYNAKTDDAVIAAYVEAETYIIENSTTIDSTKDYTITTIAQTNANENYKLNGVDYIDRCEKAADKKAEAAKNKTNAAILGINYDDAKADKELKACLLNVYAGKAATALYTGDQNLTASAKAAAKKDYSDAQKAGDEAGYYTFESKDYYAKEWDAVKAAVDAYNTAVDAATTTTELDKAKNTYADAVKEIKVKTDIEKIFKEYSIEAIQKYFELTKLNYNNSNKTTNADIYVTWDGTEYVKAVEANDVKAWIIAKGARTVKEADALYADACKVIDAYKTLDTAKTEAAAVKAQIAALPTTVTLADKEAVLAAYDAYGALIGDVQKYVTNYSTLDKDINALKKLEANDVKLKANALPAVNKVTTADKDAIKAAIAANEAYKETKAYGKNLADLFNVDAYKTALKTAEQNEIKDLYATLKVKYDVDKLTADDATAVTELQKKLADYISEYNEKVVFVDETIVNQMAAVIASLTKFDADDAKAYVQDLSIAVRTAKVGKKVKVTVNADVQKLVDNGFTVEYKFYKSTKKSSGYKNTVNKTTNTYTNTNPVKGKNYYKVKLVVKNADGTVVATTPLTQCKYGVRTIK